MDILAKKEYYINLFDFYGDLLTEKQRQYFKDYYFDDASLAEIATVYGVSRNAIFDQLQKIYRILEEYESKLGLYKKFQQYTAIYEEYKNNKGGEWQENYGVIQVPNINREIAVYRYNEKMAEGLEDYIERLKNEVK